MAFNLMQCGKLLLLLHVSIFLFTKGEAGAQNVVRGSILVQLGKGPEAELLFQHLDPAAAAAGWKPAGRISEMLNAWQIINADSLADPGPLIAWLSRQPEVRAVQHDHLLSGRSGTAFNSIIPDDPFYPLQWQYQNTGQSGGLPGADLSAPDAWNIATGGITPSGDTIVVAIIDGGLAYTHPDLQGNLWRNNLEIPGDQVDNDNNGYTDDYLGWNVYQQNDHITGATTGHGTPIAGIIGARGNNNLGVSGVNWQTKIMFVAGKGQESELLQAYDYIWKARRQYNLTNGASGAFVVALNCSWGVNYGQPGEAPLWCAAFDSLGAEGILSISAAANLNVNVDLTGDLPGNCPSPWMVTVTSLNNLDQKAPDAAWGPVNIDLGAYGANVYTINNDNGYSQQYGTSFAAPHVSGAVGLLYSAPCPNLAAIAKSDPAAAALWTRELLLENTVWNSALNGLVGASGRLDLYEVLNNYQSNCASCLPPFAVQINQIGVDSATVIWSGLPSYTGVNLRWRKMGSSNWNLWLNVLSPVQIGGLEPCTAYELSLRANCGTLGSSNWSGSFAFTTDGCCEPPHWFYLTGLTTNSASVHWNDLVAAQKYHLKFRAEGGNWSGDWYTAHSAELSGLSPCTTYEVLVQTKCDTGLTAYSQPFFFETLGCGACKEIPYCEAASEFGWEEWIAKVTLGNWEHSSGGSLGYQNFSWLNDPLPLLQPLAEVPVTITPAFSGAPYKQFFRIYIDYNGDGQFSPSDEIAFDPGFASDNAVSGYINVPEMVVDGLTRMRVMMKYKSPFNEPPGPCETFDYGEVEDYCISLFSGAVNTTGEGQIQAGSLSVYPVPAEGAHVVLRAARLGGSEAHIRVTDVSGRTRLFQTTRLSPDGTAILPVESLLPGLYFVHLEAQNAVFSGKLIR